MKIILKSILLLFWLTSFSSAMAEDYEPQYVLGKELIKQGRYAAAMEVLKPLTVEEDKNKFVEYAHYFYSLAAFKGGFMKEANYMLLQLIERYRDWEKLDEAYYLLANVAFEQKKYRVALTYLEGRKKDLKEDINKMKTYYLGKIVSLDTLINIQRDFPSDEIPAKVLAKRLSRSTSEKHKMLLEYLVQEYKLDRQKYIIEKKSVMKPAYNVAVLFPFMLKDLDVSAGARPNQFVYDMYEGIRLAVDSLKRKGIRVNLYAYDSEKEEKKLTELLTLPEMKTMDLIIGPVYPSLYAAVNDFGLQNQILVVNPLSNNLGLTEENNFVYLFQPSLQSFAGQAAQYASRNFKVSEQDTLKKVIVFQSPTPKDSLLSAYYIDSIKSQGFEVQFHEVVNRENIKRVSEILSDSIMLTKVSHIFVSSTDQVLAANIISSMEISGFKTPIFTSSDWLQFTLLTYDQFERRQLHFLSPEYLDYNAAPVYNFRQVFLSRTNALPSVYSFHGFEMMHVFGKALGKYGNYFVTGLPAEGFIPGTIFQGFRYSDRSNEYIPIVKFIDAQLTNMNHPLKPVQQEEEKKKDK